jgi:chemotaxis protein histidine kinase CheA
VTGEFFQDALLIQDFLLESEEMLQGMDQDMVALESAPHDAHHQGHQRISGI